MKYIKALFFSFLVIFFADQMLPGVTVLKQTKLPHIGSDLVFGLGLAALNTLIYPAIRIFKGSSPLLQTAVIATVLNFAAYGLINILPVGIQVESIEGYLLVSLVVTVASFIINFFDMREDKTPPSLPPEEPPEVL